jgi:hypothetical protein
MQGLSYVDFLEVNLVASSHFLLSNVQHKLDAGKIGRKEHQYHSPRTEGIIYF